jgi:hypothetical protein
MASNATDGLREVLDMPPYRAMMARLAPLELQAPVVEKRFIRDALGGVTRRSYCNYLHLHKFGPVMADEFFDWLGLFDSVLEAPGPCDERQGPARSHRYALGDHRTGRRSGISTGFCSRGRAG